MNHIKIIKNTLFAALCAFISIQAQDTIQIPVDDILNARAVTTLTDGALVTWDVGIDGGGYGSGYLTMAAALFKGDNNPKALPDSGIFPATSRHPRVQLNYSNEDGTSNQTRYVRNIGDFTVTVPPGHYSDLFLFFTSAEGASSLEFELNYEGSSEVVDVIMPDYFNVIDNNDPVVFNLALDMAKWNQDNVMTEPTHHYIDGVELHPSAGETLTSVKVSKVTDPGYLVFWGATGIASGVTVVQGRPSVQKQIANRCFFDVSDMPGLEAYHLDGRKFPGNKNGKYLMVLE